jgi:hypothetical protein
MTMPWWFWFFPCGIVVVTIGLPVLVQWIKRRGGASASSLRGSDDEGSH